MVEAAANVWLSVMVSVSDAVVWAPLEMLGVAFVPVEMCGVMLEG